MYIACGHVLAGTSHAVPQPLTNNAMLCATNSSDRLDPRAFHFHAFSIR